LLQKLLEKCYELKVEFLLGTEVGNIDETPHEAEVHLSGTTSIKADKVIYCTNAFSSKFLKNENIIPARGQILLTEPIEGLKLKGTFHYDEGFYYFRNLKSCVVGRRKKSGF
jgi:glycine/D-amino acid oxidase-like deaminating enzyme